MKRLFFVLIMVLSVYGCVYADQNYALNFDGNNSHVDIPSSSNFVFGNNNFTIETWVKFDRVSNAPELRHNLVSSSSWVFQYQNASLSFIGAGLNDSWAWIDAQSNIWYHAALARNGNMWTAYLNGVETSKFQEPSLSDSGSSPLKLGGLAGWGSWSGLDGSMDELRIWNYARTPEQIANNYAVSLTGNETGLLGYWDFNEGSNQMIHDLTMFGNDGLGVNTAWVSGVPVAPEPASYILFTLGGIGIAAFRRRAKGGRTRRRNGK